MKILITGANGFIGRKILNRLAARKDSEVMAVSLHEDRYHGNGYRFRTLDVTDRKAFETCIASFLPNVIIHTAAMSVIGQCEAHQDASRKLNFEAVKNLAELARDFNCRLIHLSTDNVFDGKTSILHKEEDIPHPINTYGKHKAMAEQAIAETLSNYAILRVVLVYGKPLEGQHGNLVHLVRSKVEAGEDIFTVNDQFRTATYVEDIVDVTEKLLTDPHTGIYHVCSGELLSIHDIALKVAHAFQLDDTLIKSITTEEQNAGFTRMAYGALDITKAKRELQFRPHLMDDALECLLQTSNNTP